MVEVVIGTGCFLFALVVYDAIRTARGRKDWAVVEAEIVDSQVVNQGSNFLPEWQAQVRYRYRVGEVQYERDWNRMSPRRAINGRWVAEKVAMRFPLGARVRVQVSPENPEFAVIESEQMRPVPGAILIGVLGVLGVLFTAYGIHRLAA